MDKAPRIILITPPPVHPFIPEAGAPYISSYLNKHGYKIDLFDAGIRCLNRLIDEMDVQYPESPLKLKKSFQNLKKEYTDYKAYNKAARDFSDCCKHYSNLNKPYGLGFFSIPVEFIDEKDRDFHRHSFLKYSMDLMDEKKVYEYDIVMFSVSQPTQFPVTIEIAKYLKSKKKDLIIIAGGAYVSVILESLENKMFESYFQSAFDVIDYMVPKLGEISAKNLLDFITKGTGDISQSYVIRRENGKIKASGNYIEPRLDDLQGPDFEGVDFEQYWTPKPVFPLRTSTRCYWGKCSFCRGKNDTFAEHLTFRRAEKVYEDMLNLYQKYDSPYFCFCEDATAPAMMTKLSRILIENGRKFSWGSQGVRFDNCIKEEDVKIWAEAGCMHLSFGLETGSQSLINKVNKGINLKKASQILDWCKKYGIFTLCYGIFGHPEETPAEYLEGLEFIDENTRNIFTLAFCQYFLTPYQEDFNKYKDDEAVQKHFDNMIQYFNEVKYFGMTKYHDSENLKGRYRKIWRNFQEKNDRPERFLSYCGYNVVLPQAFIHEGLKKDKPVKRFLFF